jgi:hypothetical protein
MLVLRLWKAYEIEELEQDLGFTLPFESTQAIEDQAGALLAKANGFQSAASQLILQANNCRQGLELLAETERENLNMRKVGDEVEWLQYKEFMFSVHARKYNMASNLIGRHIAFIEKENQEAGHDTAKEGAVEEEDWMDVDC